MKNITLELPVSECLVMHEALGFLLKRLMLDPGLREDAAVTVQDVSNLLDAFEEQASMHDLVRMVLEETV